MVGTGACEERRRCLLRARYARCFEDEKMKECVDGSKSCFETTNNLLDFSVIEAYSSPGPNTNFFLHPDMPQQAPRGIDRTLAAQP